MPNLFLLAGVLIFGVNQAQALVGGSPSTTGLFPSAIAFRTSPMDCGALAISPTRILTAAHCLIDDKAAIVLTPGYNLQMRTEDDPTRPVHFRVTSAVVKNVYFHPSYSADMGQFHDRIHASRDPAIYDLAVVEFNSDLHITPAVFTAAHPGDTVILGSGCNMPGGPTNTLVRYGRINLATVMKAVGVLKNIFQPQTSYCEGDSGSPVYQDGKVIGVSRSGGVSNPLGQTQESYFTLIDPVWLKAMVR